MRGKAIYVWIGLICLLMLGVACQEAGEEELEVDIPAGPSGQITIATANNEIWAPIEEELIGTYESQNGNITVNRDPIEQGWSENVAVAPPSDVLLGSAGADFANVVANDALLNLDLVWREAGLNSGIPPVIQQAVSVDNGQYMLPMATSWVAIYYNLEVFENAGLEPPQTWDQLLGACDLLLSQDEVPFASGPPAFVGRLWFDMINLRINGADFYQALQRGEISYDDPGVVAVFDYWAELLNNGCFGEVYNTGASVSSSQTAIVRDDQGLLDRNNAAMTLVNSFQMADLPETFFDQYSFFRFPVIDPNIPLAEIVWPNGYGVPGGAPNIPQAMEYMGFAASIEAQALAANQLGPFAVPGNFEVPQDGLAPAQIDAMAFLGEAETGVLFQFLATGFGSFQRNDLAFSIFLREPDRYQDTIDLLEEIRADQISDQ